MAERLVDVKAGERLVHTFPVTKSERPAEPGDEGFKKKAPEAAANAKVVPNEELESEADLGPCTGGRAAVDPHPRFLSGESRHLWSSADISGPAGSR